MCETPDSSRLAINPTPFYELPDVSQLYIGQLSMKSKVHILIYTTLDLLFNYCCCSFPTVCIFFSIGFVHYNLLLHSSHPTNPLVFVIYFQVISAPLFLEKNSFSDHHATQSKRVSIASSSKHWQ